MFEVFFTIPQIKGDDSASIMGALTFLRVNLITHANKKTQHTIGRR